MREEIEKQYSAIGPVDADILLCLSVLIRDQMGLDYTGDNRADLERGLRRAAGDFDFRGADAARRCATWLASGPLSAAQIETLAQHLTIGETYFFRDPALFEALRSHVWPALLQLRRATGIRELRIWSAACCTGEEPYSLAMQLHALLPQLLPDWKAWKITILATDLNPNFLKKAENAVYTAWSFRSMAGDAQKLYFDEISVGRFQLKPEIRRYVRFAPLNLVTDSYPALLNGTAQQDLIFCRNVLMYFSPEQARTVASNLIRCLNEGGYLVPAASEASQSLFAPLITAPLSGVILYQKTTAPPQPVSRQASNELPTSKREAPIESMTPVIKSRALTALALPPYPLTANSPAVTQSMLAEEWHEKARVAAGKGWLEEALAFCDRAIEEDKMAARYYYLRASILLEKTPSERESGSENQVDATENKSTVESEAEAALRRALYLEPNLVLAHFVLGNLERRRGRAAAARRSWQNALGVLRNLPPESVLEGGEDLTAGHAAALIERALSTLSESVPNEF